MYSCGSFLSVWVINTVIWVILVCVTIYTVGEVCPYTYVFIDVDAKLPGHCGII